MPRRIARSTPYAPAISGDDGFAPGAGEEAWSRPPGRPPVAVRALETAAPWLLWREAPGEDPRPQAASVTPEGKVVMEPRAVAWGGADRLAMAYYLAGQFGRRVRRLAKRERVPLTEAARWLAAREMELAERWAAEDTIRGRAIKAALADRTHHKGLQARAMALADAFLAAADLSAVAAAVPMPRVWRVGRGVTEREPVLARISERAGEALRERQDEAVRITREAIARTAEDEAEAPPEGGGKC